MAEYKAISVNDLELKTIVDDNDKFLVTTGNSRYYTTYRVAYQSMCERLSSLIVHSALSDAFVSTIESIRVRPASELSIKCAAANLVKDIDNRIVSLSSQIVDYSPSFNANSSNVVTFAKVPCVTQKATSANEIVNYSTMADFVEKAIDDINPAVFSNTSNIATTLYFIQNGQIAATYTKMDDYYAQSQTSFQFKTDTVKNKPIIHKCMKSGTYVITLKKPTDSTTFGVFSFNPSSLTTTKQNIETYQNSIGWHLRATLNNNQVVTLNALAGTFICIFPSYTWNDSAKRYAPSSSYSYEDKTYIVIEQM